MTFVNSTLSEKEQSLLATVKKLYERDHMESSESIPLSSFSKYYTVHNEFTSEVNGISYNVSVARLYRTNGVLTLVIASPLDALQKQFYLQGLRFLALDIAAILLLFFFSYFFTGKMLRPIQKAHEQQNAFIASASHELRTPLAVILSAISAANQASFSEKEVFYHTVENESNRMAVLVDDLLSLARADRGQFPLQKELVELDTLLLNSYEAFSPLAQKKNLTLEILLPEESLPPCLCDKDRITQVLAILLSNAIGYSLPDSQQSNRKITVSLSYAAPIFEIRVTDHGVGISAKAKEHIFERFYREDPSRSQKDHFGLGLCIAQEIMKAHQASIKVVDTPGGGATFILLLK